MRHFNTLEPRKLFAAGAIDTTFGTSGVGGQRGDHTQYTSLAVQRDGKILAAGYQGLHESLVRITTEGLIDTAFGVNGEVVGRSSGFRDFYQYTSVVTFPGRTYVSGDEANGPGGGGHEGSVVSLDQDGIPQRTRSFDKPVTDMVAVRSRTIYIALPGELRAFRGDLEPVTNLGKNGIAPIIAGDHPQLARQPVNGDEKILVLADSTLARYSKLGAPDETFKPVITGFNPTTFTADNDGRIVLGGYQRKGTARNFAILRLNADGSPDPTFNGGKPFVRVFTSEPGFRSVATDVLVRGDGKIIASGTIVAGDDLRFSADKFLLVRLNDDGTADAGFDADGGVVVNPTKGANQRDVPFAIALGVDQDIFAAGLVNSAAGIVAFAPEAVIADAINRTLYVRGGPEIDDIAITQTSGKPPKVTINGLLDETKSAFILDGRIEVRTFAGNDRVNVDTPDYQSTIIGGVGNDLLVAPRSRGNLLIGNGGNDTLRSDLGGDKLYGDRGDDLLESGGGLDVLYGGSGNDTLNGGASADYFYGGDGTDLMLGRTGSDRFFNKDLFHDTVIGFTGDDSYQIDALDTVSSCEFTF